MKKFDFLFTAFFTGTILLSSCSLKYSQPVEVDDKVPEFYFEDAVMTRYEDKKLSSQIDVQQLEQYKDSSSTYAKDVTFKAYDNDSSLTTEGACGLLYTDTSKDIYELYDDIELENHGENVKFYAKSLRWNARSQQLTSSRTDTVRIEKGDTVLYGTGFSASGVSKSFMFTGSVSGNIQTENGNGAAPETAAVEEEKAE